MVVVVVCANVHPYTHNVRKCSDACTILLSVTASLILPDSACLPHAKTGMRSVSAGMDVFAFSHPVVCYGNRYVQVLCMGEVMVSRDLTHLTTAALIAVFLSF